MMTEYETMVILHPEVADAPKTVREVQAVLEAQGGTIRGIDEWGMRELAYDVRRQRKGYYAVVQHTATPDAVAEFERQLRLNDDVLRFLTVRQESVPTPLPKPAEDESATGTGAATNEAAASEDTGASASAEE